MIQEMMEAKCDVAYPLERSDDEIVNSLGLQGLNSIFTCVRRGRRAKMKVQRVGIWLPPPMDVLKINTDGSSRGNLGPAGIGGVGRDKSSSIIFFFSIHKG